MVRKLSIAIAVGMLVSGVATAGQYTCTFPMSSNETGPYQPERCEAPGQSAHTAAEALAAQSSTFPISVSEVGPNESRGVPASTAAIPNWAGNSGFPISVNETGPNSGGYALVRAPSASVRTATAE
jgi:hypothetical protein